MRDSSFHLESHGSHIHICSGTTLSQEPPSHIPAYFFPTHPLHVSHLHIISFHNPPLQISSPGPPTYFLLLWTPLHIFLFLVSIPPPPTQHLKWSSPNTKRRSTNPTCLNNFDFPNSWFYCYAELQAIYVVNITIEKASTWIPASTHPAIAISHSWSTPMNLLYQQQGCMYYWMNTVNCCDKVWRPC